MTSTAVFLVLVLCEVVTSNEILQQVLLQQDPMAQQYAQQIQQQVMQQQLLQQQQQQQQLLLHDQYLQMNHALITGNVEDSTVAYQPSVKPVPYLPPVPPTEDMILISVPRNWYQNMTNINTRQVPAVPPSEPYTTWEARPKPPAHPATEPLSNTERQARKVVDYPSEEVPDYDYRFDERPRKNFQPVNKIPRKPKRLMNFPKRGLGDAYSKRAVENQWPAQPPAQPPVDHPPCYNSYGDAISREQSPNPTWSKPGHSYNVNSLLNVNAAPNVQQMPLLRKFLPKQESEVEKAEKRHKSLGKLIQFVNVASHVDDYITKRMKTFVKTVAQLYGNPEPENQA